MKHYMKDNQSGRIIYTSHPEFYPELTYLSKAKGSQLYKQQCKDALLQWIKPGDTIFTVLHSVSQSGMSRRIGLMVIRGTDIISIDHLACIVTERELSDKGGIICSGCGMDMGFYLVYSLSWALFGGGDDNNRAGYALNHRWVQYVI